MSDTFVWNFDKGSDEQDSENTENLIIDSFTSQRGVIKTIRLVPESKKGHWQNYDNHLKVEITPQLIESLKFVMESEAWFKEQDKKRGSQ